MTTTVPKYDDSDADVGLLVGRKEFGEFLLEECNSNWCFPPVVWQEGAGTFLVFRIVKG